MIEDPPPPPPGDTEALETVSLKVSRFTFNETSPFGSFKHPETGLVFYGRIYDREIIQNMFNPPDDYVFHVEYER